MEPLVSVVIPCRNERDYIGKCLESLLGNDYPRLELIVVDGMSDDGSREIISEFEKQHDNVKLLSNSRIITPVALNLGLDESNGDYIMIAGAHASFPHNYVSEMVKQITRLDNAAGVGGSMETKAGDTIVAHSIVKVMTDMLGVGNSMFRIGYKSPIKVDTLPYGLYKKEIFERIGKYDERLVRNQDIELSKRILRSGENLYLIPDVKCHYHFRGNFRHLARSNFKNGLWNVLTCYITKKISSLSFRHFVPLIFIIALLIPFVLAWVIKPAFLFISLSIIVLYLAVILLKSITLINKNTKFIYLIWSFLVLHFTYGFGSFLGLFHLNRLIKR